MPDLIERVAQAISIPEHHTTWDLLTDAQKDLYRHQAHYAVQLLTQPTSPTAEVDVERVAARQRIEAALAFTTDEMTWLEVCKHNATVSGSLKSEGFTVADLRLVLPNKGEPHA